MIHEKPSARKGINKINSEEGGEAESVLEGVMQWRHMIDIFPIEL